MANPFEKFNIFHHSSSSLSRPFELDLFSKELRRRGLESSFGAPLTVGKSVEEYAAADLIQGMSPDECFRHALAKFDEHVSPHWDVEADQARLGVNKDVLEKICQNARDGIRQALQGANKIEGQQYLSKKYPGLLLPIIGYSDFSYGGGVAELKCKVSSVNEKAKSGRRAGALPSRPDPNHIQQTSVYSDIMGVPASLVYASETDFRIFDASNCELLTPEAIQQNVSHLVAKAWARENLMKAAPTWRAAMQMLAPDFSSFYWNIDPEHLAEAKKVWGLTP